MNVLFLVDTFDWSFIRCSAGIIKCLSVETAIAAQPTAEQLSWADRVKAFSWAHVPPGVEEKAVVGICSWHQIQSAAAGRGNEVLRKARRVYAVNDELREYAEAQLGRPVSRMRHLVDTEVFRPAGGFDPDRFVIGFCGNAPRPEKRFHLVEAAVAASGAEFRGMGVGLENKTTDPVRLNEFYSGLSCLMSCSSTEGTPQPPLEAMACGTPVIASPVGHLPEIIRPGLNGFLCHDLQEFVASAIDCHRNRKHMTDMARRTAVAHDWTVDKERWVDILS